VALEPKPIALGACVFVVGSLAVPLLSLHLDWLIYIPALFAGAVTGFTARDKGVHSLLVLGCINDVLAVLLSLVMTSFGMADFYGWRALLFLAALSLPFILGLGLAGWAIVGVFERDTHA
jgi:hypothetical protein